VPLILLVPLVLELKRLEELKTLSGPEQLKRTKRPSIIYEQVKLDIEK